MTQVKQKAFELLKNISDEKVLYVIKFMRAIEDDSKHEAETSEDKDLAERQAGFAQFMKYHKTLRADFDYKTELAAYREERYGRAN